MAFTEQRKVQEDGGKELHKKGPLIVRFPRQTTAPVEPVKLESDESEVEKKPARNMVQVYILAGYLVGRWAWARFQERQDRRSSHNKKNPDD